MKAWIPMLIMCFLLLACSNEGEQHQIVIGGIEPLSGSASYYGIETQRGVDLAITQLTEQFPDIAISAVHEDSQFIPAIGVNAYRKVKDTHDVDAVVTMASPISIAVQPLAEADGVLQMGVSSSASDYSSPDDLSFRVSPVVEIEARVLVELMESQGYEKLSILYMNNEIGLSISESVRDNFPGTVDVFEGFDIPERDFRSVLTKIQERGSEAIFVPGLPINMIAMMRQAQELGIDVQFIGFRSAEEPTLLDSPDVVEGLLYSYAFDPAEDNEEVQTFVAAYKEQFGKDPDGYAAEAYEGTILIGQALAACQDDHECQKQFFATLEYDSVFGPMTFDEFGDVNYGFFIKEVRNGEFVRYEPVVE